MSLDKLKIKEQIGRIDDFTSVENLVNYLNSSGFLLRDVKFGYDYEYDDSYVFTEREETDEEYQVRIKPYTERIRKKEEKERKEYERLKSKFEKE